MTELPPKALSVRQPWAWAIIHGGKDIENRSWQAVDRGDMQPLRIAIHASKGMTRDEYESAHDFMRAFGIQCPRPDELVRGAIIGSVTVTSIVKESESPWFIGPRGLVLADPEPCPIIAASGMLGYFVWARGGTQAEPLPWMKAWPNEIRRRKKPYQQPEPAAIPLFEN